jgi:uncharacterized protein
MARREFERLLAVAMVAMLASPVLASLGGCRRTQVMDTHAEEMAQEITDLKAAYAAFNRGDIDGAVKPLDPNVDWSEPQEFPGGGIYHGVDGAKTYLTQSRAGADEVHSEPERFIVYGDKIVVFVYARVKPKGSKKEQEIRLADVYTFRNGKAVAMRAFADRKAAVEWASAGGDQGTEGRE